MSVPAAFLHCLLILSFLSTRAVSTTGDQDEPQAVQLLLPVDKSAVTRFVNTFGEAKQMTAQQVEVAYRPGYVPKGHGPDFGVPEVVTAGIGYVPWKESMKNCRLYGCPQPAPNPSPYLPTIYDWASNNPNQTISTKVMDIIGKQVFEGPFTGTILLPNDAAWAAYLARWKVPIVNTTRAEQFYANFFIRLMQYHTLLLRVYGAQLEGYKYSTVYANLNNYPHKVTYGKPGCGGGGGCSGCSSCNSGCTSGCSNPSNPPCSSCNAWYGNGGWDWKHGQKAYWFYSPAPTRKQHFKSFYSPCSTCNSNPPCSGSGCANQSPCSGSGCSGSGCSGSGCSGSGCSGSGCSGSGCSGGCSSCSGGCSSCSGGCSSCGGGCGVPQNYLIDEQQNIVTFDQIDKFIYGGGVIHTLNGVLEPNDIYPSLTAAINSSAEFSDLRTTFDRIQSEGNFSMLPTLEEIPGTLAIPTNAAFQKAGVDVNTAPVNELLNTVAYHFCAFTRSYRLLYYPFKGRPGKNPCLTILSRAYKLDYGLAWNATNHGITQPPTMWINYAGGSYPNALKVKRANIEMADLTMPIHSAAIISDLIVPPNNLPASRRLVTAQFEAQVSAAALIMDKLANRNNKRSVRRAKRKAEQRKVAAAEAKQDYVEVDADEDDEQAQGVKSPLQLVKDFAAFEQDNQRRKTLSWHYWTGGR